MEVAFCIANRGGLRRHVQLHNERACELRDRWAGQVERTDGGRGAASNYLKRIGMGRGVGDPCKDEGLHYRRDPLALRKSTPERDSSRKFVKAD